MICSMFGPCIFNVGEAGMMESSNALESIIMPAIAPTPQCQYNEQTMQM